VLASCRNSVALLIAVCILVPSALAAPTTLPTDRHAVLQQQRERYIQTVKALRLMDQHRMRDIIQLQVKDGQLALKTLVKPWPDFAGRRVQLEGVAAPGSISFTQVIPNNPASGQFEFRFEDYPNGDVFGQLRLQWHPWATGQGGDLSIEKAEQTSHSFWRMFYMQNAGMARLLVFATNTGGAQNVQSCNFMEKDFATLRRRHPQEVEQWMRPVLHWLQQDAIFAPDVNEAWQVLEQEWPVSEPTRQAVARLLPELNAERSSVRNHAADELAALGREGASAILRLKRSQLTLEQNVRLDEVIARFDRVSADAATRMGRSPDFLLDCEYCPDATVRSLATERLGKMLGHRVVLDPADADAVEKLRQQFHPAATTDPVEGR
jgi:hypothetical protein